MNEKLRNMIVVVGLVTLGGGTLYLATPQPGDRTMLELRDAGVAAGQKFVLVCPERLTALTKRRVLRMQPGSLRSAQTYATIARVAVCLQSDGGTLNCFDAAGALRPLAEESIVVVPSLRQDADGGSESQTENDAGDTHEVDDSLPKYEDCQAIRCADFDAGSPSPFATPFCNALNRVMVVPPACAIPNCWTLEDGGWDDSAVVDCKAGGPYEVGGQPTWRGCNVLPGSLAVGAACVPVNCSVVAGDSPPDFL